MLWHGVKSASRPTIVGHSGGYLIPPEVGDLKIGGNMSKLSDRVKLAGLHYKLDRQDERVDRAKRARDRTWHRIQRLVSEMHGGQKKLDV